MKIMFVWRHIHQVAGGVERFLSGIMNEMVRRGHDVSLLTWDKANAVSYYQIDPKVTWYKLNIGQAVEKAGLFVRLARMKKMREIVAGDKPDVILCFESGVFLSTKLFLAGYKIPFVSCERNAPTRHEFSSNPKSRDHVFMSLRLADRITTQFEEYKNGYPPYLRGKMVSIPNPVRPAEKLSDPAGRSDAQKVLLCVSRIAQNQKNSDVLINAFAKIEGRFPQWNLVMAGGGDEHEVKHVQNLISHLNLENRIRLTGAVKNTEELLSSAHLFCLPSRYEGFPNALAEALAHGLPAVGFSECAGVAHLIHDGINGRLAKGNDNVDTLASALSDLMEDDDLRSRLGSNAVKSMQEYSPDVVYDRWENFLNTLVAS